MLGRELKKCLRQARRVYGTSVEASGPIWAQKVGTTGVDFVFLNTEYIPRDQEVLSWMCQVFIGKGVAPVVRVPAPDPYRACMARDAGAHGVVFPYVESADQVRDLVGAVKYRPLKGKALQRALSGGKLPSSQSAYLEQYT